MRKIGGGGVKQLLYGTIKNRFLFICLKIGEIE